MLYLYQKPLGQIFQVPPLTLAVALVTSFTGLTWLDTGALTPSLVSRGTFLIFLPIGNTSMHTYVPRKYEI